MISRDRLRQLLGALWLADSLLLLQPRMLAGGAAAAALAPQTVGQPGLIAANLRAIAGFTIANPGLVDVAAAAIQIEIGLLLISGRRIKEALGFSIVWCLVTWYAGEGLGGLFTGQASVLTGAPGPVLFYALLALAAYPRREVEDLDPTTEGRRGRLAMATVVALVGALVAMWCSGSAIGAVFTGQSGRLSSAAGLVVACALAAVITIPIGLDPGVRARDTVIAREHLRRILGAFWICAAILQLQPFWWKGAAIAAEISSNTGQGGLDSFTFDPVLRDIAGTVGPAEIPLNTALMLAFLGLGLALMMARRDRVRQVLLAAMVVGILTWLVAQAGGLILTGATTDVNSGLLLVVTALACWPARATAPAQPRHR